MSFALNSYIEIGKFANVKPYMVKVSKSMYDYVDRCTIKVPLTARIVREGKVMTQSAETAKQFEEGDKVLVKMGYNGILNTEFEGFISRINFTSPLEIECEGYSFQLRKVQLEGTVKNIELKDLLKKLIVGTDIVLDENIPGFVIGKMVLDGKNGCQILESIRGASKQLIRFYFKGNVLWGGHQIVNVKENVKYRLGWNVIKDGQLKQRKQVNQNVIVNWVGIKADGSKVQSKSGKIGVVKTSISHVFTDKGSLEMLSEADRRRNSFDGYEGKITAFGSPFCEPNYNAVIDDEKFKERSGQYVVESAEVTYGMGGFRRTVGIGAKLL
jgi:hypothetical protein